MNYTPEERKNLHDSLDLFLDEKYEQIEEKYHGSKWEPFGGGFGVRRDGTLLHRPKPAPEVIPWTRETCPPLPFEVQDKSGDRYVIVSALKQGVYFGTANFNSFADLKQHFTRPDGSPCGEVSK